MRAAVRLSSSWGSMAPRQQFCSRPQAMLGSSSPQLSALQPEKQQKYSSCCLYLLDLLPLVYRYLPRDPPPAAPQMRAAPQMGDSTPDRSPAESFLGTLLTLMKHDSRPPTHMAIVVDVPGATFRHRMYPQYKAHRPPHPASLTDAMGRILAVVDALGIPVVTVPGVEADDVVGTLAVRAQAEGFGSVVIMSTDKDFYQLLSRCVSVLHGGPYQEPYTLDSFVAEQQLQDPRLWVDVKALMGDSSDNITGLKGIGEKTAKELVQRLGSVENIMQQLAAMSEEQQKQVVKLNKRQQAMLLSEEGKMAATFMKELVTINTSLKAPPCQQPWSVFELKLPDDGGKRALDWSQKLGMDWLYFKLQEHFKRISTQQS